MAGKPISRLNILIGATTTGLQKGLATAKSQIRGFQSQIETTFGAQRVRTIKSGFTAITAAIATAGAATAGLTMIFSDARLSLDEISKSAQRTGLSLRNMVAISLAAEETGATFDQARKAILDFQERLAKAQLGTGEYALAYRRLNIDVKELIRLEPDRQLDRVTAALRRLDNQAERVQIIRALFGETGEQSMLLLQRLGRDGIAGLTEEIEELGFVIDQQAATGVESMNDQINRMNKSLEIAGQQATAAVAPFVMLFSAEVTRHARAFNEVMGRIANFTAWMARQGGMYELARDAEDLADMLSEVATQQERIRGIAANDIRTQAGISQVMAIIRNQAAAPSSQTSSPGIGKSKTRGIGDRMQPVGKPFLSEVGGLDFSRPGFEGPIHRGFMSAFRGAGSMGFNANAIMRGLTGSGAPRMTGGMGILGDPRNAIDARLIVQTLLQILATLRGDRSENGVVQVNRVSIPG